MTNETNNDLESCALPGKSSQHSTKSSFLKQSSFINKPPEQQSINVSMILRSLYSSEGDDSFGSLGSSINSVDLRMGINDSLNLALCKKLEQKKVSDRSETAQPKDGKNWRSGIRRGEQDLKKVSLVESNDEIQELLK
mmetsp:Transcript_23250/g.39746  ORF Transcript_23250/g.39746 Transcript_23250/m.39746 type:complete len:138 (-) Transcript_23250:140-553(-)